MAKRLSIAPVFLILLCGNLLHAQSPAVRCPSSFSKTTTLPPGARIVGQPQDKLLKLWDAVPSLGRPSEISAEDRALSDEAPDEDEALNDGSSRKQWEIVPHQLDKKGQWESHLLACRYGINLSDALSTSNTSVLLLLPLPDRVPVTCTVTRSRPNPKMKGARTTSATCEASK